MATNPVDINNNYRGVKEVLIKSHKILAMPNFQDQGMGAWNAYCLASEHNAELDDLAKPRCTLVTSVHSFQSAPRI